MKKFYTLFIITLLACINIVLVGYSTFYFNSEVSNNPNVGVAVNNIKQNYGRNKSSSDYYDVYFFPQPRYATQDRDKESKKYILNYKPHNIPMSVTFSGDENGRTTSGNGQFLDGYWSSSKLNLENEYDINADGIIDLGDYTKVLNNYNSHLYPNGLTEEEIIESMSYRLISNVFKRLTIQQIELIGTPKTAMLDRVNWNYQFTGWTANMQSALINGYGGMNNFDLIDSLVPLDVIDRLDENGNYLNDLQYESAKLNEYGVDGSLIGDNKVFIYPIFAIGKDYNLENDPSNQPSSIDLNKGQGHSKVHKFMPKVGDYYVVKNIYFSEEDEKNNNNYNFSIDVPLSIGGWRGNVPKIAKFNTIKISANDSTIPDSTELINYPIISQAGYYNVYVKILVNEKRRVTSNTNFGFVDYGTLANINDKNYGNEKIEEMTSNIVNHSYTRGSIEYDYILSRYTAEIAIWTWVERVYEYKITGGPADTFNFYSLSSPIMFKTKSGYVDGKYTENYIANNIYFNSEDVTFKYKYNTNDEFGNPIIVTNEFRETVFTIAADSSGVGYNLEIDPNAPDGYIGISSDPNQQILKIPRVGSTINDNSDYTYTKDVNYLNVKALKVNEAGYFDFNFKVVCNAQRDGIEKILVSARKVANILAFIKLVKYVDNDSEFNRVLPLKGEFVDIAGKEFDSIETGPFDKIVSNYYKTSSNQVETHYYSSPEIPINTQYSDLKSFVFECIDSTTGLHVSSGDRTLEQLLDEGYQLIDHTTGLPIDINSNNVIRLSHIFYLKHIK